ncbi:hypothetical protein EYF80_044974 [Liparis tanakae]|uniref:Uncharacterized protein n=1 Tax=Liparis tanakae TaxID=230148 RepID=A0A4Z2FVD9_9TELE|nr:hypothetical protein EYF80_044974 [Liparis tanakae]
MYSADIHGSFEDVRVDTGHSVDSVGTHNAQVELLGVVSGVVDHAHPGHKVHHFLPGGVVQPWIHSSLSWQRGAVLSDMAAEGSERRWVPGVHAFSVQEVVLVVASASAAGSCSPSN